jgi:hypothetical protein
MKNEQMNLVQSNIKNSIDSLDLRKMIEKPIQLKILKTLLHLSWKTILENDQKLATQWMECMIS